MAGIGPAGRPPSAGVEGMGWRGPERTWPGLGEVPPAEGIGFAAGAVGRPGAITAAGGMAARGGAGASGAAGGTGFTVGAAGAPAWLPIGG